MWGRLSGGCMQSRGCSEQFAEALLDAGAPIGLEIWYGESGASPVGEHAAAMAQVLLMLDDGSQVCAALWDRVHQPDATHALCWLQLRHLWFDGCCLHAAAPQCRSTRASIWYQLVHFVSCVL